MKQISLLLWLERCTTEQHTDYNLMTEPMSTDYMWQDMAVVNLFGVKDTGTSVAILHCLLATVFCSVPVPSCDLNIASFACVQSHTYHLLCPQASALELAAAGAPHICPCMGNCCVKINSAECKLKSIQKAAMWCLFELKVIWPYSPYTT